ncbi:cobalamin B12-binding domain-containing protein [Meridianimarinicoccus aquatilis]|uniref:Cobalamin B12-binding domain-containing protein n=1 Tax=Meridianimarinicoccus aquatilis TaxID=2552766 RepID=A0A4R6AU92_9RHOB|nr:cobalamin B12-binding domain-containing protein [Fluviibacterium aquatile]TDL88171.1 cobalamin B12-binding domain-containing protein [Fluviibacterium aquatile]
MSSEGAESAFDDQGFERISQGFASLKVCLPESALNELAREVIARLASQQSKARKASDNFSDEAINNLSHALIGSDSAASVSIVTDLRESGATIDEVYLNALAPAARRLGDWWTEDRASFAQVTIGVARIYGIMHALRAEFPINLDPDRRIAAFATTPGEDHTLGVSMAADLCRKEGWEIYLKLGLDHDALVAELATGDFPIIGLSAGQKESLPALIRLIVALRISNPRAQILVAGRFVSDIADTIVLTGADAAATDMPGAVAAMERLWGDVLTEGGQRAQN